MISRIIPFLCLLLGWVAAPAAQPTLTADEQLYDDQQRCLFFRGNALLEHEDFTASADEIRYYRAENKVVAVGHVQLTRPGLRMVGRELTYHVETRRFSARDFRLGIPPYFVEGEELEGDRTEVNLRRVRFFLNEPDPYSPGASAEGAEVIPGQSVRAENLRFGLGPMNLWMVRSFEESFQDPGIRFRGDLGYRDNLGMFFQSDTLYPVAPGVRLGGAFDWYTQRGPLAGPALDLFGEKGEHTYRLELRSGAIDDRGDKELDVLGRPIDEERWFGLLRHRQAVGDRFLLLAQTGWWSDSEVLRDFRHDRFRQSEQPDNFVEASARWGGTWFSALARYDLNDFHYVVERLPEVRLDHPSAPLAETGLWQDFSASFARLRSQDPSGWMGLLEERHDRAEATYNLRYPVRLAPWATLTPVAGGRFSGWYNRETSPATPVAEEDLQRWMGQVGADLEFVAHGQWDVQRPSWAIDGLRHTVRPLLQYRWFPGGGDEAAAIFPLDIPTYQSFAEPLDLAARRSTDGVFFDRNVLRAGVQNLLQTRTADGRPRDLLTFDLYQDCQWHDQAADTFSRTCLRLESELAPGLRVGWEAAYRTEDLTLEASRWLVSLRNGAFWTLHLSADYLEEDIAEVLLRRPGYRLEQYTAEYDVEINPRWSAGLLVRYDAELGDWTEQRFAVRQRLGQSWEIEYRLSVVERSTRESDWRVGLGLRLLTF